MKKRGRPVGQGKSRDDLWASRILFEDGHLIWKGTKTLKPNFIWHGKGTSARKEAYLRVHGVNPPGPLAPTCGRSDCIMPAHQQFYFAKHREVAHAA